MPKFLKLAAWAALAALLMTLVPATASAQRAERGYERGYHYRESGSGGYRVYGRGVHREVHFRAYGRQHIVRPYISLRLQLRSWGYTPRPPRQAYARREPVVCSINVSVSMFAEAAARGWSERTLEQNLERLADNYYCRNGYDEIVINPVP